MTKKKKLDLSGDLSAEEALRIAIATERTHFLHRLHIYLAGAGFLLGTARLANQYHLKFLSFLIGWPTIFIYLVGAAICGYALYLLLHKRNRTFMSRKVSPGTQQALQSFTGCSTVASLGQISHLTVADLWQCHAQQT